MTSSLQPNHKHVLLSSIIFAVLMSGMMSIFFAGLFALIAHGATAEGLWAWAEGVAIAWPLGGLLAAVTAGPMRSISNWASGKFA